jgi:hypothetical protein
MTGIEVMALATLLSATCGKVPATSSAAPAGIAEVLRSFIIKSIPEPAYEASPGWGRTARSWLRFQHSPKKQGTWRHVRVSALDPAHSLTVDIRNIHPLGMDRTGFTVEIGCAGRIDFRQENWEAGVRVLSTSLRARFRGRAVLQCEWNIRVEPTALFVPEAVIAYRVTAADVQIDHVVVEHVLGVGGDAAKLLGETFVHTLGELHPSMERELLAKANAAIVRAGKIREIRLSLQQLLHIQEVSGPSSLAAGQ